MARASGTLPAPSRPARVDGVTTWNLLGDAALDPARLEGVCARVRADVARVACAVDTVAWAGADRVRVSLAWRGDEAPYAVTLAQPLRAMRRLAEGVCLVHAERTPRTLDLTLRARDAESVGRLLAFVTVSPGLADLVLVREEVQGAGVEAVVSWPLAPALPEGDLGDDAWPERCDGRTTVGADARPGTAPVPRERVRGTAAQGAVVRLGRREWLVTAGDLAAGTEVVAVRDAAVVLRPPARRATVLLRFPPRAPAPRAR